MNDPAREQLSGWVWVSLTGLAALVLPVWMLVTAATVQITPELAGFDDVLATGIDLESELPVWWIWAVGAARALGGLLVVLPLAGGFAAAAWGVGRVAERRRRQDRVARDEAVDADAVLEGVEVVVHQEASWDPRAESPEPLGLLVASPGRRLLAAVVDTSLLLALYPGLPVVVLLATTPIMSVEGPDPTLAMGVAAVSLLAVIGLSIVQWRGLALHGQTLGKRWVGVRVVRPDGGPAGFQRAVVLRLWVWRLITGVPIVGLLVAIVDLAALLASPDGRTLHDRLADTVVHDA